MAMKRFQVALRNQSLLPRDESINVLYYEVNAPDTVEGTMDEIRDTYAGIATLINGAYQNMIIKAYDPGPGPPLITKSYATPFSGPQGPTEVALCLSYSADDGVAGTPRRRGRIYVPLNGTLSRPSTALVNSLLTFGEALAAVGLAGNTTWFLRSVRDNAFRKIESISVDNEWDTQRRRGMRATARTRRDVQ